MVLYLEVSLLCDVEIVGTNINSGYSNQAIHIENWGWFIEITPAFLGSGMLVGLNSAISMMIGSITGWGLIGPLLVHYGECVGKAANTKDPHWTKVTSFYALDQKTITSAHTSPRYWLLWPAVMVMVCVSMTEFFIQYKIIGQGLTTAWREACKGLYDYLQRHGKNSPFLKKQCPETDVSGDETEDFALPKDQVRIWEWATGLIVTLIVTW